MRPKLPRMPSTSALPVNCNRDGGRGMTYLALAGFSTALYCRPSMVLMDRRHIGLGTEQPIDTDGLSRQRIRCAVHLPCCRVRGFRMGFFRRRGGNADGRQDRCCLDAGLVLNRQIELNIEHPRLGFDQLEARGKDHVRVSRQSPAAKQQEY